ncbi:MAG: Periplasmic glucan biosynthesis protein MdoG, partial [Gammaproteobacteria bacterium]|nr:Periplasmic glucan biosynthesis protein MdoG [Gammaproteobacteria bacterium]
MGALNAQGGTRHRGKPVAPSPPPPAADSPTYEFSFETLLADAKRRSETPYAPQRSSLPAGLDKLSPEQYRSLHFN